MTSGSPQVSQSRWQLVLLEGPNSGKVFPLGGNTVTIGRDLDNDIALDDLHVSKHHARLTGQGDHWLIEDLNSINGTLVNDTQITEPHRLQPNDTVTLGSLTFRIKDISQSWVETRAYPLPRIDQPRSGQRLWLVVALAALALLVTTMVIGGWVIFYTRPAMPVSTPTPMTTGTQAPVIVVNQAPSDNTQLNSNQSIIIQATASDPSGVVRMALWSNGEEVDQVVSQLAQDVPSLTAAFQWSADMPGTYQLEIRAYNQTGRVTVAPATTVTVVQEPTSVTVPSDTPTTTP